MLLSHIHEAAQRWANTQPHVSRRRYLETAAIDMASVLTSKHDGRLDDATEQIVNVVFALMAATGPNPRDAFEYSMICVPERQLAESDHVLEHLLHEIATLLLREASPKDDPSYALAYTVAKLVRTVFASPWFTQEFPESFLKDEEA